MYTQHVVKMGVLAKVVLLLTIAAIFAAGALLIAKETRSRFPTLTGRVVDEAQIITETDKQIITGHITDHEGRTTNQIAVVTVNSLLGMPIEEFSRELGNHWGIGQRGKSNGVLLVVAPTERKVRIAVGNGLTQLLTDAKSRQIIDEVLLPSFRSGQFSPGIREGVKSIVTTLEGDKGLNEALVRASANGSVEVVRTLLANGADVNAKGIHGMTALDWASSKGNLEAVPLLKNAGAR